MAIGGAQAFVARVPRDVEFAALDENSRARKGRLEACPTARRRTIPPQ